MQDALDPLGAADPLGLAIYLVIHIHPVYLEVWTCLWGVLYVRFLDSDRCTPCFVRLDLRFGCLDLWSGIWPVPLMHGFVVLGFWTCLSWTYIYATGLVYLWVSVCSQGGCILAGCLYTCRM